MESPEQRLSARGEVDNPWLVFLLGRLVFVHDRS